MPFLTRMEPGLYRGAQPDRAGYRQLKEMGIKTIVNFRHEKEWIERGREEAERLGMDYISLPWTIFGTLDDDLIRRFFEIVEDEDQRPVFFHCRRGVERTGLLAAFYYIRYENMPPDQAYEKAFEGYPLKWIWMPFVKSKFSDFREAVAEF